MSKLRIINYIIALSLIAFLIGCSGPGPSSTQPIAISGSKSVLYLANEFARTLGTLDLESGSYRVSAVGLDPTANDIVRRPNSDEIWVLHSETASILKYTLQSNRTLAPVFLESIDLFQPGENPSPYSLAFSHSGNYYYITNWLQNTLACYETSTNIRISNLIVGVTPQGVAVLPDGRIVVTNTNYQASRQFGQGTIMILDSLASDVINTIPVGVNPQVARVSDNYLYVVCTGNYNDIYGTLWRFNASTLQQAGTPIAFAAFVGDLAIVPDSAGGKWGYLPAWNTSASSAGTIQAVYLETWSYSGAIQILGGPSRIVALPDSGIAVSLMEADQVYVRTKTGLGYFFNVSDGPKALLAIDKTE